MRYIRFWSVRGMFELSLSLYGDEQNFLVLAICQFLFLSR